MNVQTRLLLREAAQRKGVSIQQMFSDAKKEFDPKTPLTDVANHIAGQEYEQQQRESMQ